MKAHSRERAQIYTVNRGTQGHGHCNKHFNITHKLMQHTNTRLDKFYANKKEQNCINNFIFHGIEKRRKEEKITILTIMIIIINLWHLTTIIEIFCIFIQPYLWYHCACLYIYIWNNSFTCAMLRSGNPSSLFKN